MNDRVACLDRGPKPAFALPSPAEPPLRPPLGVEGLDAALGGGIARGRVHELYAATACDAISAAGFALMLALKAGGYEGNILWLGPRETLPHGPGLAELGLPVANMLFVIVKGEKALLKAAADIVRSPAAGTLLIDASACGKAIGLTESRRLTLFAERSGVTALLLRGTGEQLPSSAETRWLVRATPSTPIEMDAPGSPAFAVDLVRRRGGPPSPAGGWSGIVSGEASRRYLALFLPMLAWDCWRAERPQGNRHSELDPGSRVRPGMTKEGFPPPIAEPPIVFTDRVSNAMRLTALSPAAMAIGLTPTLTLADARARVPELVAIERDHDAEARLLARIVTGLARYTPMAGTEPPDGAILDIGGCAHPFGGERALAADLAARLAKGGISARLGLGDTSQMARARARFGALESDILAMPVEALEVDAATTLALRRAGLKTIAHLACRPRRMLAARFGDLPLSLARLLGEEDRRITPERALPPIFALRRFAEPIARVEDALTCLQELLVEAAVTLLDRHEGGRRFAARLFRSDGAVPMLTIETGRPVRDPAIVMRLFRERLEALSDPIDPGFGFDCVRLDIPATEPLAPAQTPLERQTDTQEPIAQLIDRLAARLGPKSIRRAIPLNSHIPECQGMLVPANKAHAWPRPRDDDPPVRPLHLIDPPARIDVTFGIPEGPPRRFTWRGQMHEVARWEGPERIGAEWWRKTIAAEIWNRRDVFDRLRPLPPGSGGLTRDYYRVEDRAGHRFWVFRHGIHAEKMLPDWYLHGIFA